MIGWRKCALHMRNEIPQHIRFPVSLRSSFFPFSLYFHFSSLSLKGLERIQIQIRKGLTTHSLARGCIRPLTLLEGKKEGITVMTDTWYGPWELRKSGEAVWWPTFAGSAGLGDLAKVTQKGWGCRNVSTCSHDGVLFSPHCLWVPSWFLLPSTTSVPISQIPYQCGFSQRSTASVNVLEDGIPSAGTS